MSEIREDYWTELGRRAVACAGWRWMPGMRAISTTGETGFARRIEALSTALAPWHAFNSIDVGDGGCVPDLRDAATVGCLLALVREAWGDKWANAGQGGADWWEACCEPGVNDWHTFMGETEAEALVRALENALMRDLLEMVDVVDEAAGEHPGSSSKSSGVDHKPLDEQA